MMIKVAAVSYLNTIPFIYGLRNSLIFEKVQLSLEFPSVCADKLLNNQVDIALVPVVALPRLHHHHIISDYCIGANGNVDTVCLFSDVPISEIQSISLDYQSHTSVELLKVLLREYWKLSPNLIKSELGFEDTIKGKHAALVIGDRAFSLNNKHKYIYDLSAVWKQMTALPFVFAVWVANIELSQSFIIDFNKALKKGLSEKHNLLNFQEYSCTDCKDPEEYLNNRISYILDAEKQKAMDLFLSKL